MKRMRVILLAVFILLGSIVGLTQLRRGLAGEAAVQGIAVSGNIEVVDAALSFKINGRVAERAVDEGEPVQLGQPIARLDDADLLLQVTAREADVALARSVVAELEAGARPEERAEAEAAVQLAKARLDELLTGSRRQELGAARAEVAWASAEAERAGKDYQRFTTLYQKNAISKQQLDAALAADTVARERVRGLEQKLDLVHEGPRAEQIEQARAALKQVEERFALVMAGPRSETIDQAKARLAQAEAGLALAITHAEYARLVSPMDGTVLSKSVEPGEYVSPGTTVITVGNLDQVFLRAYIEETELGRVKLGQPVKVTTDTFPDKTYEGQVVFIASEAEFTPKSVQTAKERVKLVYRLKIDIPNPDHELKPGMPADALLITE